MREIPVLQGAVVLRPRMSPTLLNRRSSVQLGGRAVRGAFAPCRNKPGSSYQARSLNGPGPGRPCGSEGGGGGKRTTCTGPRFFYAAPVLGPRPAILTVRRAADTGGPEPTPVIRRNVARPRGVESGAMPATCPT